MGGGDLARKGKWVLTAGSFALVLALNLLGCGREAEKTTQPPEETPLQKAERLLTKDDIASLKEARAALQEALAADPQAARVHYLLGTTYAREAAIGEHNRESLEELYTNAITELEKALELSGETGAPVEVYQQLVDVYRKKALLPKRFKVERDEKVGVGPWEVKAMEKAIKTFEEGRALFPDAPAFNADTAEALKEEMAELRALYVENVERVWSGRPSGYMPPEEYRP